MRGTAGEGELRAPGYKEAKGAEMTPQGRVSSSARSGPSNRCMQWGATETLPLHPRYSVAALYQALCRTSHSGWPVFSLEPYEVGCYRPLLRDEEMEIRRAEVTHSSLRDWSLEVLDSNTGRFISRTFLPWLRRVRNSLAAPRASLSLPDKGSLLFPVFHWTFS